MFGHQLSKTLKEIGIETTGLRYDTRFNTTLAFVHTKEEMEEMLTFANAAASIITTHKGALRVMPSREEVEKLLMQK